MLKGHRLVVTEHVLASRRHSEGERECNLVFRKERECNLVFRKQRECNLVFRKQRECNLVVWKEIVLPKEGYVTNW